MSVISLALEESVRIRGLCRIRIDRAIEAKDQFNITRWAVNSNYFADLEEAVIRRQKRQAKKAQKTLLEVMVS